MNDVKTLLKMIIVLILFDTTSTIIGLMNPLLYETNRFTAFLIRELTLVPGVILHNIIIFLLLYIIYWSINKEKDNKYYLYVVKGCLSIYAIGLSWAVANNVSLIVLYAS